MVVVGVEDKTTQRRFGITLRGRHSLDDGPQKFGHPFTGLGRNGEHFLGRNAEHALELFLAAIGVGRREIDLVKAGHDFEVVLEGLITVGESLGLNALRGVDQQHRAFAGRQGARDFVAKVDVSRGVDELQDVVLEVHADVLGLDGDATFTLNIHGIEVLSAHQARVDSPRDLQDAVRQGGFAVVDVGNNREVADFCRINE